MEQRSITHLLGIEGHLHHLRMSGAVRAHVLICGLLERSTLIPHCGFDHARYLLEACLHPPEAARSKRRFFHDSPQNVSDALPDISDSRALRSAALSLHASARAALQANAAPPPCAEPAAVPQPSSVAARRAPMQPPHAAPARGPHPEAGPAPAFHSPRAGSSPRDARSLQTVSVSAGFVPPSVQLRTTDSPHRASTGSLLAR